VGSVKSYGGPIAARFFLELCEGGLLGGMVLYLSMFYRRHHLRFRLDMFYCAAPLSGAFGGLLATGLAEVRFHGYNRWPWVFFCGGGYYRVPQHTNDFISCRIRLCRRNA